MKKDKKITILLELSLSIILLLIIFCLNNARIIAAIVLIVFTLITTKVFKIKQTLSINKKNVLYILGAFAVLYILLLYLLGIYFGFYSATIKFSMTTIVNYIIPITVIIIASEYIRQNFLCQKIKKNKILVLIPMILVDTIIYKGIYDITKLEDFLEIVGYILSVSIANNLLFNYICEKYGKAPNILYRLVTVLYVYIIPIIPDIHILIHTLIKLLIPYIIYIVLENTFQQKKIFISKKQKRTNKIITAILILLMLLITMLVSCKFKYGVLVIGSESMTGTINKGDAIIFEQYKNQKLKENQILVFRSEDRTVIHRIVEIKNINNEKRYYTKGDSNKERDLGYVTDNDIVGIYRFKISRIGQLTLAFNDIF